MMIHIIEKLRCFEHPNQTGEALMQEAADRIEALESTLRQAREALAGNCTNPVADPEQAALEDEALDAIDAVLSGAPVKEE